MEHRLTIQPWGTGIRVQCTCRPRPVYATSSVSTEFQTIIDAAVQHMDENPSPLLTLAKSVPPISAEQWRRAEMGGL